MEKYTGSTSCDDRATRGKDKGKIMVNLKENVREEEEIQRLNDQCVQYGKPPHYDLEKAQRNITYENCLTNEEAFMYVLGEAMESFNASQKRNDRKTSLEKELEKLEKGKVKQELIHTLIVQVGNKDSRPSEEECVEILKEYLEQFRERFPNMKIVNAAIHLDEDTPHLQMYFIPVKTRERHEAMETGKKWSGMDVQPSLKGALEQMGYSNDASITLEDGREVKDYKRGAMAQWQKDFNGLLDEICLTHGIELDHYMRGQKVSHQDTLDYQEGRIQRDVTNAKNELNNVEADLTNKLFATQEAQEALQDVEGKKTDAESDLEALRGKYEALEGKYEALEGKYEVMEAKAKAEEARAATAEKKANEAEAKLASIFSQFKARVEAWIHSSESLRKVLRRPLKPENKEKIEQRREETSKRGAKAITMGVEAMENMEDLESAEDVLAAGDEVERSKKSLDSLRTAAREDLDPDTLEGWER